jgi:DNA-binding transcriptional LysR family regulator
MDRLQAMTMFLAVADGGSFAAAARRLKVSPSVVTRAIAALEQRLGARLLTRTTRMVRVTQAGASYAEDCRRLIAGVEEAEAAAAGAHRSPRGQLTITSPILFGRMYVTPIVVSFLARHPELAVSCYFVDRLVNLVEEGVDVAIRIAELGDSSLQAVRVGQVRRVVCAAPGYLARHGTPQRPQDLAAHTLIAASGGTPSSEWRFRKGARAIPVRLRPRLATTTNDSALAAALAGFGVTRLLSYQVARHVREGKLKIVLAEFEPPPMPIHVVHREGRNATQRVRLFLDAAIAALRADRTLSER